MYMRVLINKMNNCDQAWLSIVVILLVFLGPLFSLRIDDKDGSVAEEINVGVILDMASREGKTLQSCISMAISDFYSIHDYYKTRVVLHTRDSKGESLAALSSVLELLQNFEVHAIIGGQTSLQAKFLAELGDKTKVPIITFSPHATSPSSSRHYRYFLQVTQPETFQAEATATTVAAFGWRDVIIVHEDSDDWIGFVPHLVNSLQKENINVARKTSFACSLKDDKIIEELHELMSSFQQTVFIVHMSPCLTTRIFENAKQLGMMGRGYAWIMTVNSMNHLNSIRPSSHVSDSMQGVIGLRSYIPASDELRNFTSRWRKIKFHAEHDMEAYNMDINIICIWAYDVAWGLAKAAEKLRPRPISLSRKPVDSKLNLILDLDKITTTSRHGNSILLKQILQLKFKGLSGEFQFVNGKLAFDALEIVNMLGRGERRVGFWTSDGRITRQLYSSDRGRRLSSSDSDLEDIIWPGGYAATPKGYVAQTSRRSLRIAVPGTGFTKLVNIDRHLDNNVTSITGYCIDVFKAAMKELPYEVDYEFIPYLNSSGQNIGTYDELIYDVFLQKYDGAVGDITITANRTLYVDFTLPYSDLGVGMVAPKGTTNNMWIFLKPLKADLWLSIAGLFVMTGFVIWLIERPINNEFQGPLSQQIGMIFWFSFSTLAFAHRERLLSNFSRFVVIVWVFVVLILTSSYTATLTSMITIQQIQLNSKENYIGYQKGSFTKGVINNPNFKNSFLRPFKSPEEYANALSRGNKKGGVSAIIDEIPYIKVFLAKYSADYSMVRSMSTANCFGFVFRKGSPLVQDMSRAIAKLRENGTLNEIENASYKFPSPFTSDETLNNVKPLTIDRFRGLFLISGFSSALALAMLYICRMHRNWHVLKNYNFREVFQARLKFAQEYLSKKLFGSVKQEVEAEAQEAEADVHQQAQPVAANVCQLEHTKADGNHQFNTQDTQVFRIHHHHRKANQYDHD